MEPQNNEGQQEAPLHHDNNGMENDQSSRLNDTTTEQSVIQAENFVEQKKSDESDIHGPPPSKKKKRRMLHMERRRRKKLREAELEAKATEYSQQVGKQEELTESVQQLDNSLDGQGLEKLKEKLKTLVKRNKQLERLVAAKQVMINHQAKQLELIRQHTHSHSHNVFSVLNLQPGPE